MVLLNKIYIVIFLESIADLVDTKVLVSEPTGLLEIATKNNQMTSVLLCNIHQPGETTLEEHICPSHANAYPVVRII